MSANPLAGSDVLSADQFSPDLCGVVFERARQYREALANEEKLDELHGRVLVNLFYEPSTRTSASFAAAMLRLGGQVFPISEIKSSSVTKGETLADTVRTLDQYADVIVIRNPEVGAAQEAAEAAEHPVINAGDGIGEHPTQALLDLFTIIEERGGPDGLTVTFVGDLKYGRTVHSLAKLLSRYDVTLNYVSPKSLGMPTELKEAVTVGQHETTDLESVLPQTDVLYVTRVQQERFPSKAAYEQAKGNYVVTPESLEPAKDDLVVIHPLPRVDEIDRRVDADPRAAYFREVKNGLYVRMALLALVLDGAG